MDLAAERREREKALAKAHAEYLEENPAVKKMLHMAISACRRQGKYIGICGQGPSDHPELAKWLLDEGIESMSLNPDTVVETWLFLAGQTIRLTTMHEAAQRAMRRKAVAARGRHYRPHARLLSSFRCDRR